MDARSSSDVWAVGQAIVHWDGRALRTTALPWKNAALSGVSALSPVDVWAVGNVSWGHDPDAHTVPLTVHWNGHRWRRIAVPAISGRYVSLADVVVVTPSDVWAVGSWGERKTWPLLIHWDGSRWHRVDLQRVAPALGDLHAIAARAPDDIWAAGMEGDWGQESYGYADYVLHWDGHRWRRITTALAEKGVTGPYARALDVSRTGDVWTLNGDLSGNGPIFVSWNSGSMRSTLHADWITYDNYEDIAAISSTDVWVVGQNDYTDVGKAPDTPLVAHWDGTKWRVQDTPFERYAHVALHGISAASRDDIWAVGNHIIVRYAR